MDDKELLELYKGMLEYKKREVKFLFFTLIAVVIMSIFEVTAVLYCESQFEMNATITTEQEVEEEDGDQANCDTYDDESESKSNKK